MADPTMNRQSGGLDLTPQTQAEIWQTATYQSAFMQLSNQFRRDFDALYAQIVRQGARRDRPQNHDGHSHMYSSSIVHSVRQPRICNLHG